MISRFQVILVVMTSCAHSGRAHAPAKKENPPRDMGTTLRSHNPILHPIHGLLLPPYTRPRPRQITPTREVFRGRKVLVPKTNLSAFPTRRPGGKYDSCTRIQFAAITVSTRRGQ